MQLFVIKTVSVVNEFCVVIQKTTSYKSTDGMNFVWSLNDSAGKHFWKLDWKKEKNCIQLWPKLIFQTHSSINNRLPLEIRLKQMLRMKSPSHSHSHSHSNNSCDCLTALLIQSIANNLCIQTKLIRCWMDSFFPRNFSE